LKSIKRISLTGEKGFPGQVERSEDRKFRKEGGGLTKKELWETCQGTKKQIHPIKNRPGIEFLNGRFGVAQAAFHGQS